MNEINSLFTLNYNDVNVRQTPQEYTDTHKASFRYDPNETNDLSYIQFKNKAAFFKNKRAILFISVGQAYHECGKFLATINLLNKYAFKECHIMLADTLQRYNFIESMGEIDAHRYTKKAGDAWLKRNSGSLNKLAIPQKITRWDELLSHPDYSHLKEQIENEYLHNCEFKSALHHNVDSYLERLQKCNPGIDDKILIKNGLNYLIEELPIVMPIWAAMGYDFIIYPKPITTGMKKTYDLFVKTNFPEKCRWIYLRFKK